jgi:hypothetical protein
MHGLRVAPPTPPKRKSHDAALTRALKDVWIQ